MSDKMTAAEYRDGESLIASMQQLIEGHDPAVAAYALMSVLASLVAGLCCAPLAQARHLGNQLIETVKRPPESRSVN